MDGSRVAEDEVGNDSALLFVNRSRSSRVDVGGRGVGVGDEALKAKLGEADSDGR